MNKLNTNLELSASSKIIRKSSNEAAQFFVDNKSQIDILHIDGNHDTEAVRNDFNNYLQFMSDKGIVVFDDIDWESVNVFYTEIKNEYIEIYNNGLFAILFVGNKDSYSDDYQFLPQLVDYYEKLREKDQIEYKINQDKLISQNLDLSNSLQAIESSKLMKVAKPYRMFLQWINKSKEAVLMKFPILKKIKKKPKDKKISVIITTFNHEKYIAQCIESVLNQKGNFSLEIIVGDDNSSDNTRRIISGFVQKHPDIINLLPEEENLGVSKNLYRCINACSGDYIAICEGDDYWINENKLEIQTNYLEKNSKLSMCFSSYQFYFEDKDNYTNYESAAKYWKKTFTTRDIIKNNFIGNFSCCVYRSSIIKKFPKELFDIYTVDWMFNIYCSLFGKLGFINTIFSVYRKHNKATWSGLDKREQTSTLISLIDTYDKFLKFKYKKLFKKKKDFLKKYLESFKDLIIFDTVFPHPLSAFRFEEFFTYLENFDKSLIFTTGAAFTCIK